VRSTTNAPTMARRQFLRGAGAALAACAGTALCPRSGWANAPTVYKSGDLEALVVSDGRFVLPTGFLVTPDAPPSEREALLKATGQGDDKIEMANNIAVIRGQSAMILIDAGTGPRHQATAGKLVDNLKAAGIQPEAITHVVLTHGHPDHLWGVLDASHNPIYPNASYVLSAVERDFWTDTDVMRRMPAVLANDRIVAGARTHISRISDRARIVRNGDEIVSGVRVIDTPGHTPGHISVELGGGDGLLVAGDALTHMAISFQYPSWRVPVDHEPDRAITTRLRLLDLVVSEKRRLVGAHLPFPGTGLVERKDGAYRFVAG
jgi:glyoxylase-like metal-dependent hydrolase (beta-lactamase superfamily II)